MIIINKRMKNYFKSLTNGKGFTLIELLVVIGILGVLAAALLVTIDPLEQFARGRDAGRLSTVDSIGHALEANFTSTANGTYMTAAATFLTTLQNSGDLKIIPTDPAYTANGATAPTAGTCPNGQNNFCYETNAAATDADVYTRLESKAQCQKAHGGTACGTAATQNQSWVVWSSADGRTGVWYGAAAPTAGALLGAALY